VVRCTAPGWAAPAAGVETRAAGPNHTPVLADLDPELDGLLLGVPAGVLGEGQDLPVDPRHFLLYIVSMSSQQAKYRPPPPSGALELAPDCLMFAIDDTGHERLRGQSIYGLGGCAIMGRDYYRVIRDPWTRRRAATTGDFGGRLRAAEFGRRATPANMAAMGRFFANQPFYRFAAVATLKTEYPRERELMAWVMLVLKVRIAEILSRTPARSVALVFEASQRADPLVIQFFGTLELKENGQKIPIDHCFLAKNAGEPALEVADFIMHAVGRAARHRLEGKERIPPDFVAVFRRCHPLLTSLMFIDRVEERPDQAMDEALGVGIGLSDGMPVQGPQIRDISFPSE
jgi:hypothetical protein